ARTMGQLKPGAEKPAAANPGIVDSTTLRSRHRRFTGGALQDRVPTMPPIARTLLRLQFLTLNGRPRRFRADRQSAPAMKAMRPVNLQSRRMESRDRAPEFCRSDSLRLGVWR